ncbi:MAG: FAD:protein FMN transferase [Kiritimatiellae bacterium]|nr:FAD:protein FMN transferase [Kiritimatiellia bacterium]
MNAETIHRFSHEAMHTEFEVYVCGGMREDAHQAALAAFREVDRLEAALTRFDPCSDIGQINALRAGEKVVISADVMDCLLMALWVHEVTSGAFDVTVGSLVDCFVEQAEERVLPVESDPVAAAKRVGMERLVIDVETFTVGLRSGTDCTAIDLGGIGKGFALDRAARVLEDEWELDNVLLHGGASTILAIGDGETGEGWSIGVGSQWEKLPGEERVVLHDEAFSQSGPDEQGEHIIDPRTCRPDRKEQGAWARCPSAAIADALSTAFINMKPDEIMAFCSSQDNVCAGFVPPGRTTVEWV